MKCIKTIVYQDYTVFGNLIESPTGYLIESPTGSGFLRIPVKHTHDLEPLKECPPGSGLLRSIAHTCVICESQERRDRGLKYWKDAPSD